MSEKLLTVFTIASIFIATQCMAEVEIDEDYLKSLRRGYDLSLVIDSESKQEIEDSLNRIVRAVINQDVEQVTDEFSSVDKERIKKNLGTDYAEMNLLIHKLTTHWAEKYYGLDFNDGFSSISVPFEIGPGAKEKLATIDLRGFDDISKIKFRYVDEGEIETKWRLDVSDEVTAETLNKGLLLAIKDIIKKRSNWPSNQDDAYRYAAQRILAAVVRGVR